MRFRGLLIAALLGLLVFMLNRKAPELGSGSELKLLPIGHSGYELQSTLELYNPNFLSSTITEIAEKVYINGHLVSISQMALEQGIPGRKTSSFPTSVRFDREAFGAAFPEEGILENNAVEVSINGKITYRNFMGGDTIPINLRDTILIDVLP